MPATRLLILGALRFLQPSHGYEIRRELESWEAERWANVAYGSIYFALNKMADEGLVQAVDQGQAAKRPGRTQYVLTDSGKAEFERLLRQSWWERRQAIDPFYVAVAFMDAMPKDELLAALRKRAADLQSELAALEFTARATLKAVDKPRHVLELLHLFSLHAEADLCWTEELLGKVERGEQP